MPEVDDHADRVQPTERTASDLVTSLPGGTQCLHPWPQQQIEGDETNSNYGKPNGLYPIEHEEGGGKAARKNALALSRLRLLNTIGVTAKLKKLIPPTSKAAPKAAAVWKFKYSNIAASCRAHGSTGCGQRK